MDKGWEGGSGKLSTYPSSALSAWARELLRRSVVIRPGNTSIPLLACRDEIGTLREVHLVRTIVALSLLTCWPVMTSHVFLQQWGVIHEVHSDHDGADGSHGHSADNHAFADGGYLKGSTGIQVAPPFGSATFVPFAASLLSAIVFSLDCEVRHCGPGPPGTGPPGLSQRWQFSSRAALPIRAPSLLS